MKFLLAFLLLAVQQLIGQRSVSGVVLNGTDNTPLPSASVFINNSSKGIIAGSDGKFTLSGIDENDFELVISYSGYTPRSIKITASNIQQFQSIVLQPREIIMNEVTVQLPEKDGWKKYGSLFIENFLGTSDFASDCKIENPEVILFFNNKKQGIISAHSNENIIIRNNALGYTVRYLLEGFNYDPQGEIMSFYGYALFEDMQTKNAHKEKKWIENRQDVYKGSIMHFMRSLYKNKVSEEGFDIREMIRINSGDSIWSAVCCKEIPATVKLNGKLYNVVQGPPVRSNEINFMSLPIPAWIDFIGEDEFPVSSICKMNDKGQLIMKLISPLRIVYKNGYAKSEFIRQTSGRYSSKTLQQSVVYQQADDPLAIGSNGTYFDPLNIFLDGYWGWCKMAFMLPLDYVDE